MDIAGVDEAGRGCVIGPLVMCAFACNAQVEKTLRGMGVRDSKEVPQEERVRLYGELKRRGKFTVDVITAELITQKMRAKISLNDVEAESASLLLERLHEKIAFERAYVDSPDPRPEKFEKRIRKHCDHAFAIVSRNKADRDFPVVGAASIIAKAIREEELAAIKKQVAAAGLKGDLGTGYSHDERTIKFLNENWSNPHLKPYIRWEWATAKNVQTRQMDLGKFL